MKNGRRAAVERMIRDAGIHGVTMTDLKTIYAGNSNPHGSVAKSLNAIRRGLNGETLVYDKAMERYYFASVKIDGEVWIQGLLGDGYIRTWWIRKYMRELRKQFSTETPQEIHEWEGLEIQADRLIADIERLAMTGFGTPVAPITT